ncbi:MAG: SagB/ThcOx family dehydrogenase [Candidatus Riflebacteria bacterium]|nr:SagB/ThcOx family dehydrogenase [Candidatus Riflebacteria bacterium]
MQEFRGAPTMPLISLPDATSSGTLSLEKAIASRRSIRSFVDAAVSLAQISQLLWAAQGITSPQKGFRAAPSAGATYPLSLFLITGNVETLAPGVYLYHPRQHALEKIVDGDRREQVCQAALSQRFIASAPAVIAIAGVLSRTTRRYGKRGEIYVYMEAGHAGQNIYLQAASLGLGTVAVGAFKPDQLASSLELLNSETPLYLFPVGTPAP